MQMRRLGNSGLQVSAIGLGGMPLSVSQNRPSEADGIAVIHHAIACGINFIDTADAYCLNDTETGHNERLIGKALQQLPSSQRDKIIVATKGGLVRPGGRWDFDGSPKHLREACEASLKALGVSAIDLYQYHRIDPKTRLEESMEEIKRLQEEGKIRFVGVSNFSTNDLERALTIVPIVSLQNEYSRKHRDPETDGTLTFTRSHDMAFLPWSPLDGMGGAKELGKKYPILESISARWACSPHQVVLAWLLAKGPQVIPIPGASRKASIEDSAKAVNVKLSADEIKFLDQMRS